MIPVGELQYSEKYEDTEYEYRHVIVPRKYTDMIPKHHLMTETEWRNLGIQQSPGWIHYLIHKPEPNVLLFRRKLSKKPPLSNATNRVPAANIQV
ncbi:cyclin-dependent kinases regulatory subunit 1-like [Hydractinia symbiolongicarpus]|uniref:cyclin-dependent kinases regulatory subunit 1-like n=1 Tax=Hydractinia symbiolongicarpus TaxID=13093 RepID=UPI00254FEA67|nr:cyclin-dependent kinases regulatory subunit 1-like [Hydractinia symbiolongicarpus]